MLASHCPFSSYWTRAYARIGEQAALHAEDTVRLPRAPSEATSLSLAMNPLGRDPRSLNSCAGPIGGGALGTHWWRGRSGQSGQSASGQVKALAGERGVETVWEANTPRSDAPGELRTGELITMKEWLTQASHVLPKFGNFVPRTDDKPGVPNPLPLSIGDTGEKAFQRAFFLQRKTTVLGSSAGPIAIEWLDIETAVVNGPASRRPCLDMIGAIHGTPCVIAELKAAGGTSPFDAIQEVLSYGCSARDNHSALTSHPGWASKEECGDIPHFWPRYEGKYLMVGGPNEYWEKWKDQWGLVVAAGTKWLVDSGLVGHQLIFVAFPQVDFRTQKGESETYTPRVGQDCSWTVLFEAHASAENR